MLGIDIGSYSIKAAIINRSSKVPFIEFSAIQPIPHEMRDTMINTTVLRSLVSQALAPLKKRQKSVALSIPTSAVIFKTFTTEKDVSDDFLQSEVQMQLIDAIPFTLDQVYFDFVHLNRETQSNQQAILIAASRRDIVDHRVDALDEFSIKRKIVDIEAFALGQTLAQIKGKTFYEHYAIVDIGYRSSSFQVFNNEEMIFNHIIPIGGQDLTDAIAEAMNYSATKAEEMKINAFNRIPQAIVNDYLNSLTEQCIHALEIYDRTQIKPIDLIYITGGGTNIPDLLEYLNQHISNHTIRELPLEQHVPFDHQLQNIHRKTTAHSLAIAAGLSLRAGD